MRDSAPATVILIHPNIPIIFKYPPPISETLAKNFFATIIRVSVNNLRYIMTLNVTPELGVSLEDDLGKLDLPDRAAALSKTVNILEDHGLDVSPDKDDQDVASILATSYAQDPAKTSTQVTTKRAATLTPPSIRLANEILREFNHSVVESSIQLRHLVTNKLIIESENPDARTRMRALELLGKISDVGLFAEKSEVTITHQTTDDIKERLRGKLAKLVNPELEVEDVTILDAEEIDLDDALGNFDDE